MLTAIPKGLLSWDFTLCDGDRPVAEIWLSWWPERGALSVNGVEFNVRREGLLSGAFLLENAGNLIARATKPNAFRRLIEIRDGGNRYVLEAASYLGRAMVVSCNDQLIGALRPQGFFTWRMDVDLPADMSVLLKSFIFWLAVLLWKRDAEASGD